MADVFNLGAAYNIAQQKPQLYAKIVEAIGKDPSNSLVVTIANNEKLFYIFHRSTERKFVNVIDALDKLTDDLILLFIAELKLYGLYTVAEYVQFTKKLSERMYDDEDGPKIISTTHQIVLADKKQKMVFVYASDNIAILQKISKYVKECFGADVKICTSPTKTEITLQTICDDCTETFDKLFNYIYKYDAELTELLSLSRIYREREYKYRMPKLDLKDNTTEQLIAILKTTHGVANAGGVINIVINNIVGNNNVIGDVTIDWIKNNPPINHEQTSSYYKRYCDTANNKISIKDFNKKVSTQGFIKKRTPKFQTWTLDEQ